MMIAVLGLAALLSADPVTLKAQPVDDDGAVTLGELFDGAGSASGVVVGRRLGPSIVFEAGQLQAQARQAGLAWDNPTGLRRVVVRQAAVAPDQTFASALAVASPAPSASRPAAAQRIISRNDMVEVVYEVGGVRLSVTGRAEGAAVEGQRLAVRNLQSNRVIDAVAFAPGKAFAGPSALALSQQFASR